MEDERRDAIFIAMTVSQKMSEITEKAALQRGQTHPFRRGQLITELYKCFSQYQINKPYRPIITGNYSINHKTTLCDNEIRCQLLKSFYNPFPLK